MVRLLCLTFYGSNRSDSHTREHLHETPALMWAPLVVLALLSIFVGYIGIPEFLAESMGTKNFFAHYLSAVVHIPSTADFWSFTKEHHAASLEWTMMLLATGLGLTSAGLAYVFYHKGPSPVLGKLGKANPGVYSLLLNKYWVDEIYAKWIVHPLKEMADFLWRVVDVKIINGFLNFLGSTLMFLSSLVSLRNTGGLQRYAAVFMLGLVGLIFLVIS